MNRLLRQIKSWQHRFEPKPDENTEDHLNRLFTEIPKEVLDYLIGKYYQPIEFVGGGDPLRLAEKNGQQLMVVDILTRVDIGLHPMLYQESPGTEEVMDGRQ